MLQSNIHSIIDKLDDFIRKYYRMQCVKGLLLFLLVFIAYSIVIFLIEYIAFLPVFTRTFVFYTSLCIASFAIIKYICIPLARMYNIGKRLSYIEASRIIQSHFPEIKDSLLNALELSQISQNQSNDLLIAAINQKSALLSPIPFSLAVDIRKLLPFWKYAAALVIVVVAIMVFYPQALLQGATRIVKHSVFFEKPAPFSFHLSSDTVWVERGANVTIALTVTGEYIPNSVEIQFGGNSFFMRKKTNSEFEYDFQACNNSLNFNFFAEQFTSKQYTLLVKPLPQLVSFTISAKVPQYTGIDNFTVSNTADITVPAGTQLSWNVSASDITTLVMNIYQAKQKLNFVNSNKAFSLKHTVIHTTNFTLQGSNTFISNLPIIDYTITVIPDLAPIIDVASKQDTSSLFRYYFKSRIQDDYGFTSMNFVYFNEHNHKKPIRIPLDIAKFQNKQDVYFMFDFSQFEQGKKISYYFEITDNDKVNGYKTTRSSVLEFAVPSKEEIQKIEDQITNNVEQSLSQSIDESQELLKDIQQLQKKLLNQNMSDWERKQTMQEILQKQESIEQKVKEMSKMIEKKHDIQNTFSEKDAELLEKQKQIEELLQNLMNDELKKLFDEFNSLLENFKRDEFMKKSEDMKLSVEDLAKQMDRDLEMLKRMDVEQKMEKTSEKLSELSKMQENLAKDIQKQNQSSQELLKQQQELSKEIQKVQQEYNEIKEKNSDLKQSFDLPDFTQEFNEIKQQMQQSGDQMQQKQMNKSSKSMQKSSEQTQSLADKMEQTMQQQMQQQAMEDIDNIRQIIDNLLVFSHSQEALVAQTNKLSHADPKYAQVTAKQNALRDNFSIIRDSLYSLSLRVPQISSQINNELFAIHKKMKSTMSYLENQQRSGAMVDQQYIMTSTNNLLLLLGEVLEAMQQSAAQQMQGQQQCNKPSSKGSGKPSMQQMQQMQQSLKQQMQQMIQQMQQGNMQGKGMQKELSQMLMQQQMMQQMMQQMIKDGGISPEGMQQLKEIQKMMDKNEQDIINQSITPQTLLRQEQIVTRLLESDKALRERDIDKKRESNEANDLYSQPKYMFKDEKNIEFKFEDVLKQTNLKFNSYYQKIFQQYLQNINDN